MMGARISSRNMQTVLSASNSLVRSGLIKKVDILVLILSAVVRFKPESG